MSTAKLSAFPRDLHATPDPGLHTGHASLNPTYTLDKPDLLAPEWHLPSPSDVPWSPGSSCNKVSTPSQDNQAKFPSMSKPPCGSTDWPAVIGSLFLCIGSK